MTVFVPRRIISIVPVLTVGLGAGWLAAQDSTSARPTMRADGTTPVRSYELPVSKFLTPEARKVYIEGNLAADKSFGACTSTADTEEGAVALRRCLAPLFAESIAKLKARYPVEIEPQTIGGIYTEVVTPVAGISPANKNRVLINVHGGGFIIGSRTESQVESIPIAASGRIKVVSVDYRMGPEHQFPAASQDVAAVYRAILKEYRPENVGIYGCSAGGLLTAQSLAWFQKQGLPTPGAAGMFCAAASYWDEGDSGYYVNGGPQPPSQNPYLKNANLADPLVFPINSPAILAKFPPSLASTALSAQQSPTTGYAPIDGLEMYYEVHGSGEPVVLLHGAFMTITNTWAGWIDELSKTRKVIAVELQGHGRTADIPRELNGENHADDVAALLEYLGISRADLIGYSMGGGVAMQVAVRHPDHARRVVVISSAFRSDGMSQEGLDAIATITAEAFADSPLEVEYKRLSPTPEQFSTFVERMVAAASKGTDLSAAQLRSTTAPMFFIHGDADGIRLEHVAEMFRLKGGGTHGDLRPRSASRLAILPNTTHVTLMERMAIIVPMVNDFLDAKP